MLSQQTRGGILRLNGDVIHRRQIAGVRAGFALLEDDVVVGMDVAIGSAGAVNDHVFIGDEDEGFASGRL